MKWNESMLIALVIGFSGVASAQNNVAQDRVSIIPFQQKAKEAKGVTSEGLAAVTKEAPHNPFDHEREPQKHAIYSMQFKKRIISSMDEAVKDFVVSSFKLGMSLQSIINSSKDMFSWSQWPDRFGMEDIKLLPGVCDEHLDDEAWLAGDNEVVIIYATFTTSTGAEIHFFQNSFRAPAKDRVRQCPSLYVIMKDVDGEIKHADLYMERLNTQLSGGWSPGDIPRLLGFLPLDSEPTPGIMVWSGPSGRVMNFGITLYTWSKQYRVWEGAGLWGSEKVLSFDYNADSTDFAYYQCYEPQPEGPNILGCPSTVNLRKHFLANKEYIESQRKKNVAIGSPLSPPKEKYEEQGRQPSAADPSAK